MASNRLFNVVVSALLVVGSGRAAGLEFSAPAINVFNDGRGQDQPRGLEIGKAIEAVIGPGDTQLYSLPAKAGEFIHVFIYQRGVNIAAALVGPDGTTLVAADS